MSSRYFISLCIALITGIAAGRTLFIPSNKLGVTAPSICDEKLKSLQSELLSLTSQIQNLRSIQAEPPTECQVSPLSPVSASKVTTPLSSEPPEEIVAASDPRVAWRVSAIGKVVSLTDAERERLTKRYLEEVRISRSSFSTSEKKQKTEELETLDAVLGADRARQYRDHVKQAFVKAEAEENEKELLLMARRLGLNQEEESRLGTVYRNVDETLQQSEDGQLPGLSETGTNRVQALLEKEKKRQRLLEEEVKKTLSAEQFQGWLALQSDSSGQDMEMFHSAS